jgi:inorganic pyrophosphatase
MTIRIFIQNESGSTVKHLHDEKALTPRGMRTVAHPYPFPYGFVIDTDAEDGANVDCFVLTRRALRTGQIVECEPIGLMEQFEDGMPDHNVLTRLLDESADVTPEIEAALTEHVIECFRDRPEKKMQVGRFLSAADAEQHLEQHSTP